MMRPVRIAGQWSRVDQDAWARAEADRAWIELLDRRLADDMDWYAVLSDLNEEKCFPLAKLWRDEGGSE